MNHHHVHSKSTKYCLIIAGFLLLAACSGPATRPVATEPLDPLNDQALAEFANGEIETAAEIWASLASQSSGQNRSFYLLRAADSRIMLGQYSQATALINDVEPRQLDNRYLALFKAVQGELFLNNNQPAEAERILATASTRNNELQQRIELLLEKAIFKQQSPTLRAWQEFEQTADSSLMNDSYALTLMHTLDPVPASELQQQRDDLTGDLPGWIDLVLIARSQYPDTQARLAAIADWRSRNILHRLTQEQAYRLSESFKSSLPAPARVSILLPQSGNMATMAAAIRDGLMSSYLDSAQKNQSELKFLSTNGAGLNGLSFADSVADLANTSDHVIGPLGRKTVSEFMTLKASGLPLLALNLPQQQEIEQSGENENTNTLFFPLLPEDEARSAARRAISVGYTKMLVIAPQSKIGDRLVDAFVETYLLAGGKVIASNRYLQADVDHSANLKQILGVASSQQRGDRLQRILGMDVGFEASIRGDIDAIFLVANPRQGRLIKPQLKFLDAGHLPVLSTSLIYTGNPDRQADRDLNGISITTNHLALRRSKASKEKNPTISSPMPTEGNLDRFFALGADSWSILPWLPTMYDNPQVSYSGLSGQLSVTADGRLAREPVWAVFRSGRLELLKSTPLE